MAKGRRKPQTPTLVDVARAVGVSVATVSNALNDSGRMSPTTRKRILEAVQRLNYAPRPTGRRASALRQIALIIEEQSKDPERDAFLGEVIYGIKQIVHARGFELHVNVVSRQAIEQGILPELWAKRAVRGAIILEGGDVSDAYIREILACPLPVILVDNYLYDTPVHSVTFDSFGGAYLAVRHLIQLGHRRIGIIRGPDKYKPLVERFMGYIMALNEAGIPFDPELARPCTGHGPHKGRAEMRDLLRLPDPPTAVFCVSDKVLLNVLPVIRAAGLRIPDDLSIVGFDDIPAVAGQDPPITTVRVPKVSLGHVTANRLFNLIDYPDQPPTRIQLPIELVVRASTAAPASLR